MTAPVTEIQIPVAEKRSREEEEEKKPEEKNEPMHEEEFSQESECETPSEGERESEKRGKKGETKSKEDESDSDEIEEDRKRDEGDIQTDDAEEMAEREKTVMWIWDDLIAKYPKRVFGKGKSAYGKIAQIRRFVASHEEKIKDMEEMSEKYFERKVYRIKKNKRLGEFLI